MDGRSIAAPHDPASVLPTHALRLRDRRTVDIRPASTADTASLGSFYGSLSPSTLRLRFLVTLNALPAAMRSHVCTPGPGDHLFIAQAAGMIVAEARYAVDQHDAPHIAELAMVTAEDWRRIGLGKMLLQTLLRDARQRGLTQLHGDVLWDNIAMRGLLTGLDIPMTHTVQSGVIRYVLHL